VLFQWIAEMIAPDVIRITDIYHASSRTKYKIAAGKDAGNGDPIFLCMEFFASSQQ